MQVKILIVEDSAVDMLIIKNMLSEYSILTARDGIEAMQILEKHDDIDLLILDLNMPNMDGFQVLERLKSDARRKVIYGKQEISFTVSIGVAAIHGKNDDINDIEDTIKMADDALYKAKAKGRNCVVTLTFESGDVLSDSLSQR